MTLQANTHPNDPQTLSTLHKYTIVFTVSWVTFAATFASTSILSAMPEIASDMSTTVEVISITNAALLAAMGCSWLVWGPVTDIVGRIPAYNAAIFVLLISCIGTAISKTLVEFTATRVIGGFTGTAFMITGQGVVADIFTSGVQGTVVGVFLSGSVVGPALGPCIGGIIVTYTTWRVIYWVQTAMAGLGLVLSLWAVRDIQDPHHHHQNFEARLNSTSTFLRFMLSRTNPTKSLKYLLLPNILFIVTACSLLSTYQYFLLTTIRLTINPLFSFTMPLTSGLFYIAPGTGFLLGSILGGWVSDRMMRYYSAESTNMTGLPQDRLNSCLANLLLIFPASMLGYGWSLEGRVGGLAVAIITSFCGGACLMAAFTVLNTYLGETLPSNRSAILADKFIVQYAFAAASNAVAVPLLDAVGVGVMFTICVFFPPPLAQLAALSADSNWVIHVIGAVCVFAGGLLTFAVARCGADMKAWATARFAVFLD